MSQAQNNTFFFTNEQDNDIIVKVFLFSMHSSQTTEAQASYQDLKKNSWKRTRNWNHTPSHFLTTEEKKWSPEV